RAFAKIDPSPELLDRILAAIERQKRDAGQLAARVVEGRSTVPQPTTWLNGRRWQDDEGDDGPPAMLPFRQPVIKRPQDNPALSAEKLRENAPPMAPPAPRRSS